MSFPRQHTQGPWQIRYSEMNKNLASVTDNSRNPIAPCVGPQAEANARLIAAAPTMFDLLTAADRLEILTGENLAVYARTFAALARAAIAKATAK